jgi:regulator of protease activity HflC (stomatin/prohibitin superfamily)
MHTLGVVGPLPAKMREDSQMNKRAMALAVLAAASIGCVRVESGGAGVLWTITGGTQTEVFDEGIHIVAPWNRMVVYDVRTQDRLEQMQMITNNGLAVGLEVSLRYRPVAGKVSQLHAELGPAYYDKILKPALRAVTRDVVGQFSPEEVYSVKREEVADQIFTRLAEAAIKKDLIVEAVLIRNIVLPEKLRLAIADKLEMEQQSLKMKFVLEREQQEAERKRIEARGIADFQKIVSKGINAQLLQWKGIEATESLAKSQNAKVVVIGSGKDGLPLILGGSN